MLVGMDYKKIYNNIIERGKTARVLEYSEKHHIIPKCMNGSDVISNISVLTPKEHYLAHYLLMKIHNTPELICAFRMMCISMKNHNRIHAKRYEYLKIKHSKAMSELQHGNKNSQYGTCWVFCPYTHDNKSINKNDLSIWEDKGWVKGRGYKDKYTPWVYGKRKHPSILCEKKVYYRYETPKGVLYQMKDIADACNVHENTVRRWFKKNKKGFNKIKL